jgi:hypothetical protein
MTDEPVWPQYKHRVIEIHSALDEDETARMVINRLLEAPLLRVAIIEDRRMVPDNVLFEGGLIPAVRLTSGARGSAKVVGEHGGWRDV